MLNVLNTFLKTALTETQRIARGINMSLIAMLFDFKAFTSTNTPLIPDQMFNTRINDLLLF